METAAKLTIPRVLSLSGSSLKVIAVISMVVNHCALFLLPEGSPFYELMRCVGRIAFPVFAFLIAEGFAHSRNRLRNFLMLLGFGLLAEISWQLLNGDDGTHNVMFTLALGVVALAAFDRLREHRILPVFSTAAIAALSYWLGTDYDWRGILMIVLFYILRQDTIDEGTGRRPRNLMSQGLLQGIFTLPLMAHYGVVGALLATTVISLYDGRRGYIRGVCAKYMFYAIYPLHLLLIIGFLRL